MQRRSFFQVMAGSALGSTLDIRPAAAQEPVAATAAKPAATQAARPPRFGDARDWFFHKRFGMFVHWGLYAIPAWHEQHQWRKRVPRADYVKLAAQWNPTRFDPNAWLDLMQEAGMSYLCVTTKHHDGFCLWDTQQTTFKTTNTPHGRDVLRLVADACHARGVPLCLYYSIADWNHPSYPNQGRHHELPGPGAGDQPDWGKYLEFLKAQVRELCTGYGELHGFWWDMNVPRHEDPSINAMIRQLQPKAVINNRGFDAGDFGTPERDYEADGARAFSTRVEACQSVGMESWGYRKDENYYTDRHLMRSIDRYLARDANFLLNVGPKADGSVPDESVAILKRLGTWYRAVSPSLVGVAPASHVSSNNALLLTTRERTLYVHLNPDPRGDAVKLPPIDVLPLRARLLNDGRPLQCVVDMAPSDHVDQRAYLRVTGLPANEMANTVMVAALEFDRPVAEIAATRP